MGIVSWFERTALFNITRALALLCSTASLIGIIIGSLYAYSVWYEHDTILVSAHEVIESINSTKHKQAIALHATSNSTPSPLAGYKVPFPLQKYLSGENATLIYEQFSKSPDTDRQMLLEEMGAVATDADTNNINFKDAISEYIKIKEGRYADAQSNFVHRRETLLMIAEAVATGICAVALFGIALVLLAIERNTRHTASISNVVRKQDGGISS